MKILSAAPHIRSRRTTKNIMLDVLIALLPATIAGIVYFGWQAAVIIVISLASAALTEFVWYIIEHKIWKNGQKTLKDFLAQFDFTSLVTGLLLALAFPPILKGGICRFWEAFCCRRCQNAFRRNGQEHRQPCHCRPNLPVYFLYADDSLS